MASAADLFPCFGIASLGLCTYNPAQPSSNYFTVGDAVAALAFTLAVQQLFKPIHLFRLRAYGLKVSHLMIVIFFGASCAGIALVLPNISVPRSTTLAYPIFWELLGGVLIGVAYLVASAISLSPARVHRYNVILFAQSGASLLASANEDDRVSFAEDLFAHKNLARLVEHASAWQRAETHGLTIEFEKLRSLGAPQSIQGRPPVSAFYLFSHRRELSQASYAASFLRILSDPEFCSVLVRKRSWLTARALADLSAQRLFPEPAQPFVQAIGSQAILHDESMMTKEVSYTGFSSAPLLSNSLFENYAVLSQYDPLGGIDFSIPDGASDSLVRRLCSATSMMLKTAIKNGDYWPQRYTHSAKRAFEQLSHQWNLARSQSRTVDFKISFHMGINDLSDLLMKGLEALEKDRKRALFVTDPTEYRTDLVSDIADIIFESLEGVANTFNGVDDDAWLHAIDVFIKVFPFHDSEPEGVDPLQQQLALKLLHKLRDNMNGYYPAISRVLLAVIGPYAGHPIVKKRTAFVMLKDAVYKELQKLPQLVDKKPDKLLHFLPANVSYDPMSNSLTHTYSSGNKAITSLSELIIPEVDFADQANWRP